MKKFLIVALLALVANINMFAQDDNKMYTAFIVNVARNIAWNGLEQDADFVVSVMGNDKLCASLSAKLNDKFIGFHKVIVKSASTTSEVSSSSMVVMSKSVYKLMPQIANDIKSKPCVIIACSKDQCANGADLSLYNAGDKLSFQLSDGRIKQHGLAVSAKLRDLGEIVD